MSTINERKTRKRMRGVPVHHDELKKPHTVWLTGTTWKWLQLSARESNTSVGELVEKIIRSEIKKD
ncbi:MULTISPECIES: hypothetical protein [Moorena]|uniref:CopG-like ribbon-helix-helix domain-containing protein n=1 Tax=Moorena producens 3L TaxID=489825 RepID=F4XMF2_9CYAN|nr:MULTISPECIES: hypothetical protein [Moorena]EGJ33861.1 hypothetical protein LYNGBM3L_19770 [Moorena producens 3L]NEP37591.1 hypothetical protein [Moorena sp. SIO3B2]NES42265.1 hypothetical protein [Moorena sp. SIO2C4]OLT69011.1 hypothetical protein BI334_31950 [Moorena producens 3L]